MIEKIEIFSFFVQYLKIVLFGDPKFLKIYPEEAIHAIIMKSFVIYTEDIERGHEHVL